MEVKNPLIDVVDQWKPYVPSWYHDPRSATSTTSAAPSTNTTYAAVVPTDKPSGYHTMIGAIAGIVIGAVVIAGLLGMCGWFAWSNQKKAKQKDREKAQLADAMNPNGVTRRIDELTWGPSSHEELNRSTFSKSSPIQPRIKLHYDVYRNFLPRVSEEHHKPAIPGLRYDHDGSEGHYENPTANKEHYVPGPPIRAPPSQASLGITVVSPIPHSYRAYKPSSPDCGIARQRSPYDYGIGMRPSRRSDSRISDDSMRTTTVTASPVQSYSMEPLQTQPLHVRKPSYDEYGRKITYR
jgi:hypothetical protein